LDFLADRHFWPSRSPVRRARATEPDRGDRPGSGLASPKLHERVRAKSNLMIQEGEMDGTDRWKGRPTRQAGRKRISQSTEAKLMRAALERLQLAVEEPHLPRRVRLEQTRNLEDGKQAANRFR